MDKLKKQIKEAKEARKQQKKEAKKSVGLFDGAEVTYPDHKGGTGTQSTIAIAAGPVEDLLVVKRVEYPNLVEEGPNSSSSSSSSSGGVLPELSSSSKKKTQKLKKMKITMDGEVKVNVNVNGEQRKKITFDDDGAAVTDAKTAGLQAMFKGATSRSG